ncbi:MAG: divalent-cation tolerance protein CutA [Bryobacteraceae bacterium]
MTDKILVFSSCGSEDEARRIGRALVESRLAACVNVFPRIWSVYRWHGVLEAAEEWTLVAKSTRDHPIGWQLN